MRTNDTWLSDLRSDGPPREAALADLRVLVLNGLPRALAPWISTDDPRFASLAEETVQETLLRVIGRLNSFEGRSQFTTWVYKIALRLALSELRRQRWQEVSLDDLLEGDEDEDRPAAPALDTSPSPTPETRAEQSDLMQRVQRILEQELTERQRQALIAVAVRGLPLEEVARRMHTQRGALYKLIHDARLRLKHRLEQENLTPAEVLSAFAE